MSTALQVVNQQPDTEKVELIKQTVARGATDMELALFLYTAKRTGLDPLLKQIYAIKRWDSNLGKEAMTIQTGIDGFRLVASRTGKLAGIDDAVFEDAPGVEHPIKATVTVHKLDETGTPRAYTASARWDEYKQTKKDGTLTAFWKRMPFGQLGKCAEALALRKAFPADLSGVYSFEEMQQQDSEKAQPWETKNHEVNESTPAKCEKCAKDIVDIDNPQGGKFKKLTALQAIAFSEKNHGASWCWDCISAEKRAKAEPTQNAEVVTQSAQTDDATPDPFFTKDLSGKLVLQGTVTEIKDGNPFVISFGKERISTFSKSMKEMLKEAKGKKVIAEYTEVEKGGKTFKNLVDVRRVGDQEYDGGLPVTQLNADLIVNEGDTKEPF